MYVHVCMGVGASKHLGRRKHGYIRPCQNPHFTLPSLFYGKLPSVDAPSHLTHRLHHILDIHSIQIEIGCTSCPAYK